MANRFLNNIRINDAYTLPASDGTNGQVITTDGTGNLTFEDVAAPASTSSNYVYYEVKNSSGSTINKGTAVRAVGTDGNSGHILIAPMIANGSVEPKYFMGVTASTLNNGDIGQVVHFGEIDQLDTTAFQDGDVLWCDPANNGGFTTTEPLGPNLKIAAAIVINAAVNGKIKVRVQGNEGLHELHDVKITTQADGELLVWNNTTGVWMNDGTITVDHTNNRVGINDPDLILSPLTVKTNTSENGISIVGDLVSGKSVLKYENYSASFTLVEQYADFSGSFVTEIYGSEVMRINSSGNVGIGTSSPATKLHVNSGSTNNVATFESTDSFATVIVKDNAGSFQLSKVGTDVLLYTEGSTTHGNMRFLSNSSTERMRIDSSGSLLINNTSTYGDKLVVNSGNYNGTVGSASIRVYTGGGTGNGTYHGSVAFAAGTGAAAISAVQTGTDSDRIGLSFWTHDTDTGTDPSVERMRIDSSGNIIVGGTTAQSSAAGRGNITINGSSTAILNFAVSETRKGYLYHNGTELTLSNDVSSNMKFLTGNTEKMRLEADGDLHVDGDVVAYSTTVSDQSIKDDVVTIDSALDKVNALRGVEYTWNALSRKGERDIGFIAQEVEEVIPEVVREKTLSMGEFAEEPKTVKTLDYEKLTAVLVEAIKDQQKQIDELKAKLDGITK